MLQNAVSLTVVLLVAMSSADAVRRALEARYWHVTTLKAVFLERYSEAGRNTRIESGTVSFRRPGKMRWEYDSPEHKLFVSDGKTVWFYVPGDKTAMRAAVKESSDWRMPFALLTRDPSLDKLCSNVTIQPEADSRAPGQALLRCAPKDRTAGITDVLIGVDSQTGDIQQVVVRQPAGVQIEFTFADWKLNPPLPDSEFRFAVPAGVAIVEGPDSLVRPAN